MNEDELFGLIQQFTERPVPSTDGRHVYLWHGDLEILRKRIPQKIIGLLDLHQIVAELPRTPNSQDEAARLLRKVIQKKLYQFGQTNLQQISLIVGCDLLSRYKVPLTDFFALASETQMFIFVVLPEETHFRPTSPLPDYISLNPLSTLNYLRGAFGETNTIDLNESPS